MGSYGIGLSGLRVAQGMIDLVSTNIANANTEGYHRQEAVVDPVVLRRYGGVGIGGAEISSVRRSINNLLEMEITRQQGNLSQASEELSVLQTIEAAFGDVGTGGLAGAIDHFFTSLTELSSDPKNEAMRVQAVWAGDAVAGEFRNIGRFLEDVENQVRMQAEENVRKFNSLCYEINDFTKQMVSVSIRGGSNNILSDKRDQAVRELAELADIQINSDSYGSAKSLSISASGAPVVSTSAVMELEIVRDGDGKLGIGTKDAGVWRTTPCGGEIGAMMSINNDILGSLRGRLDTLVEQIAGAVNGVHTQGVGALGSFTELTGVPVGSGGCGQWSPPVQAGSIYVRITEESSGAATRSEIVVDPTDTLSDMAAKIDAVAGLSASVVNSALKIESDAGFKFDFLPALLADPHTSAITGDATVELAGIYSGAANQIYTCRVVGSGQVGVDAGMTIEIRDEAAQLVETVNIGQGYAAGDRLDLGLGMTATITAGQLNDGDEFTIQALADTDTAGFLAAAGVNSFFTGSTAANIYVRQDVLAEPGKRFACSSGAEMTDKTNIEQMIAIGQDMLAGLGDMSIRDYYRGIVTGVGQSVVVREARVDSLESVMLQLNSQRDDISGVDLNEETAKLISLERMYQGMARVIAAQDKAMGALMDLL